MIEVTREPISPERIVSKVKNDNSGCVATYVGLIRNYSHGKEVHSVEYDDSEGKAVDILQEIIKEVQQKWPVENVAISHRVGKLKVGDINLVVAVAAAHRGEGFSACQYIIDRFKSKLPTRKVETYQDGSVLGNDS